MTDPPETPHDDAGSLVRPYVLTSGRQQPATVQLDMISLLVAVGGEVDEATLEPEQLAILRLCARPLSVAEVSSHLDIPVAVVKVLVSDLIGRGHVITRAPRTAERQVSRDLLEAVLDGIQQL